MTSEINSTNELRASPAFKSRLAITDCGILVKSENELSPRSSFQKINMASSLSSSPNGSSLRVPIAVTNSATNLYSSSASIANNSSGSSSNNNNNNNNSPKMGSRRIFTPQFKLQVLEAYRNDSDCKGNQRATARKFNIHRRQIQKWLQCESNLRSSVANINQNSIKHQFHNISHQQPPQQQQQQQQHQQQYQSQAQRMQLSAPTTSLGSASNGYGGHHHHHPHPLDAAHQTITLNSLNVPSLSNHRVPTSNATSAQGVLAAANLAAAAAVAVAIASSTSSTTTAASTVSPLRPTAIGGTTAGSGGINTSILHSHHQHHHHPHHQQQQHYPISPYSQSPVAAPVPVPINMLAHHHHHHHHITSPAQAHAALHQHYSYHHNLSAHTHPPHALPPLSHQPSAFLPTACLPVNVLSAAAAATSPSTNATTTTILPPTSPTAATTTKTTTQAPAADVREKEIEENCTNTVATTNVKAELCEEAAMQENITMTTTTTLPPANAVQNTTTARITETTTATTKISSTAMLTGSARSYMHEYDCSGYRNDTYGVVGESMRDVLKCKNFFQQSSVYVAYPEQLALSNLMTTPIDLSLGSRRKSRDCSGSLVETPKCPLLHVKDEFAMMDNKECQSMNEDNGCSNSAGQVVDLTFRKRKVVTERFINVDVDDTEQPQKLAKHFEMKNSVDKETVSATHENMSSHDNNTNNSDVDDEDDEVDIEVGVDVEAKLLCSKPVKLFKPYLLDDDTNNSEYNAKNNNNNNNNSGSNNKSIDTTPSSINEQREPIIWSNHPECLLRSSYDSSSRASSLQSPASDKHTFPVGSPHFLSSKPSSPQSVLSPTTSAPALSPSPFPLRCPKGSPVSGYESSSSICSERDDTCSRTYSLDFQMHPICDNKIMTTQPIHIREWLNQDMNTNADTNTPPPLARASIALYA